MKIKIFTGGGTIDKIYSDQKGTLNFSFSDKQAVLELFESKLKLNFEYKVERLLMKDSLEMNDEDRQLIKKACESTIENKILITHGTDTMIDTAKVLSTIPNKVIVLTGASQPYQFRESDAEFNVGVAIGALNVLNQGVYICMNGRVYQWDKCEKRSDGIFMDKN
ncbi:MAG: asparaginase domain-containing protein [Candidatus Pacebacteria bacterium]|nr:asparaginase domain-containing protein [Candidatus Paceibacterota bacterium]